MPTKNQAEKCLRIMCSVLFIHCVCSWNFRQLLRLFYDRWKSIFLRSKSGAFRTCCLDAQPKFQETRKHCELCDKNENGGNGDGDNVDTYIELLVASVVCKFNMHTPNDRVGGFFIESICFFFIFLVSVIFSISFWTHRTARRFVLRSRMDIFNLHNQHNSHGVWSREDQT